MNHPTTAAATLVMFLCATALAAPPTRAVRPPAAKPDQPAKEADNPYVFKPRTRSVAVFKNGFGFFLGEGETALRDGWATATDIPPATFGTLAIFAHDQDKLVDIVGAGPGEVVEFDDRDAPADAAAKRARLEASRNLKVQLTYIQKGQDRSAAGKLVSVGPEYVVLESDNNSFAVPLEGVTKMQMLDLPLRIHVAGEQAAEGAEPAPVPERAKLGMAYLRQGVTWIPSYTLRILDDSTAELTLRGTLVNEAEDIVHADVHFVVGVPHFLHTQYLEPIAVGQMIRTIGAAVAPAGLQSQIMNRAAISNNSIRADQFAEGGVEQVVERPVAGAGGDLGAAVGNLPQMESAGGSDFTVYTKKDLTVRRGEKAIVTLFVKKIKYSHIYRWSPPEQIQHFLLLQNDNGTPLTTGPCLAVSGDQPLSEDLLKYTPKGGKGEFPVTTAVNVATDQDEAEVDRKLKAYSPSDGVHLDLVTLKGELKVRNFEKTPAEVIITVQVPGKPVSASDEGRMAGDPTKLTLTDRAGTVRWRVELKPGETKNLSYTYERYVKSN